MQQFRIQFTGPGGGRGRPPGLLTRMLFSVAAVAALVVAAFLGAFVFLAALGFFLIASVVLAVRIWWARRQLDKAMRDSRPTGDDGGSAGRTGAGAGSEVIEGEYLVVDEERRRRNSADEGSEGER